MSDKPDTLEQAIEDLFDHQGVHGVERDRKRRLLLGLVEDLESESDKAEWREYALLQVLQDKPVTPWETWRKPSPADGLAAIIRHNHPNLTDEEVEAWIDCS